MRFLFSLGGTFIVLCGGLVATGQLPGPELNRARARRFPQQQQQPQNPADFAPDPPPVPEQTPATRTAPAQMPQAAASPTPVPGPPEQLPPATPPQVSFRDGLLTVVAVNSNLGALLNAIRNKTGIQFEGLENGAPERVAISMGPAPEGDVLAAILGGSSFDYVVMERPDSPGIVQRVVLSSKGGATAAANAAQPGRMAERDAEDDEEAAEEPVAPQDTPVRPPLAQLPPQQPQQQPTPQPRTMEQMLDEIKRRQSPPQQNSQPQQNAPIKAPLPSPPEP